MSEITKAEMIDYVDKQLLTFVEHLGGVSQPLVKRFQMAMEDDVPLSGWDELRRNSRISKHDILENFQTDIPVQFIAIGMCHLLCAKTVRDAAEHDVTLMSLINWSYRNRLGQPKITVPDAILKIHQRNLRTLSHEEDKENRFQFLKKLSQATREHGFLIELNRESCIDATPVEDPSQVLYSFSEDDDGLLSLTHTTFNEILHAHIRNYHWIQKRNEKLSTGIRESQEWETWAKAPLVDFYDRILEAKRLETDLSGRTDFPEIPHTPKAIDVADLE